MRNDAKYLVCDELEQYVRADAMPVTLLVPATGRAERPREPWGLFDYHAASEAPAHYDDISNQMANPGELVATDAELANLFVRDDFLAQTTGCAKEDVLRVAAGMLGRGSYVKLPDPLPFEGPEFDSTMYLTDPYYSDARTQGEAAELRGFREGLERVYDDDFRTGYDNAIKLGRACLWRDFTWRTDVLDADGLPTRESARDRIEEEKLARVRPGRFYGMLFQTVGTHTLAFLMDNRHIVHLEPYHDYDVPVLARAAAQFPDATRRGEVIVAKVLDATCNGGVGSDPHFHWRVYSCVADLYRVKLPTHRRD